MKGDLRVLFRPGQGWTVYPRVLVHTEFTVDILDTRGEVSKGKTYLSLNTLLSTYIFFSCLIFSASNCQYNNVVNEREIHE